MQQWGRKREVAARLRCSSEQNPTTPEQLMLLGEQGQRKREVEEGNGEGGREGGADIDAASEASRVGVLGGREGEFRMKELSGRRGRDAQCRLR